MFVLHIDLPAKNGEGTLLEQTFANDFLPAISVQEGFHATHLMRSIEGDANYCLTIEFTSPKFQQKWIATDLHERVWSRMQKHCSDMAVRKYNVIA
jgi:heme-degrading monooxygenase HmoA